MVNPNLIYRKTEAGVAEFQTRKLGLRAELRRLLILIDGMATLGRLAAFVRGSEIDFLVTELEQNGLIALAQAAPVMPILPILPMAQMGLRQPAYGTSAGVERAPAPSPSAGIDGVLEPTVAQVEAVRSAAIRTLHEILGPDADAVAMKIENCKTSQEMRVAITDVRLMLDRQRGAAAGQRFIDAMRGAAELTR